MPQKTADILIVEDEAIISMLIRRILTNQGYQVIGTADTGERAMGMAALLEPDLVLMDIQLKGELDGIHAADHIMRNHAIPVIFVSSHSDPHTIGRAMALNPAGYVLKPIDPQEMIRAVEAALQSD